MGKKTPLGVAIRQQAKENAKQEVVTISKKRTATALLERLSPTEREFLRLYADPSLQSFGNASEAARLAGVTPAVGWAMLKREHVEDALRALQREREAAGREVDRLLTQHAMDGARELIRQVNTGQDMELINPADHLDLDNGRQLGRGDAVKLKELNAHNRNVIALMKARKEASETLVAYEVGTPEQRVRIQEEKVLPDVLDLESLTPEQLKALSSMVEDVREMRTAEVMEIEAEIVETS
jgi:hypothetical protein